MKKIRRTVRIRSPINKGKFVGIKTFLNEYNRCVNYFIHRLWSEQKFEGKFINKKYVETATSKFDLTTRLIQCAGKQAFQIVKTQRKKSKHQRCMPRFKELTTELDSRFWEITPIKNSYEWVKLQSGFKFFIPFNKTIMWNKWGNKGFCLSKSMRITVKEDKLFIDFIFEKEKPPKKTRGNIEGLDLGYIDTAICSDGQVIGKEMNKFIQSFDKREKHTHKQVSQKTFHELKKLDLSNIKVLVLENLHKVKSDTHGRFPCKHNRRLSHWLYAKTTQWLEQQCEEKGISIIYKSPWKTSQFCRLCGKWDKRNRKGKIFKCVCCGHTEDADSNASQNIKLLGLAGVYSLRSLPTNFYGKQ